MKAAIILSWVALLVNAGSVSIQELHQKSAQGLRLLSLAEDQDPVWKSEDQKLELIRAKTRFFDITEVYEENEANKALGGEFRVAATTYPSPSRQAEIKPLLSTLSIPNMQQYLGNLTAFNNRYYRSTTGAAASKWIQDTVAQIATTRPDLNITISPFTHSWVQSSTIARIEGSTSGGAVTILGAHMDSINQGSPTNGRAPGADDDGSGSVNLIEAFRALLASKFVPKSAIEFHWYSGEEGGLLGSQAIATRYKTNKVAVKAMLQLDMTAYTKPGNKEVIALMPDYIDTGLNTFVGSLIDTYLLIPWVTSPKCGYACSDHASWYNQGYATALPFETPFGTDNPTIHTTGDTISVAGFSWTHTLEYAKLALAFAYELGA